MGLAISRFVKMLFARKEMRILMVGLDAAGKTTILYKLKLGEIVTTIPTIGTHYCLIIPQDLINCRFGASAIRRPTNSLVFCE